MKGFVLLKQIKLKIYLIGSTKKVAALTIIDAGSRSGTGK